MATRSKIFIPSRCLGYVSNHVPLQVRYIKNRKENLIITCVGRSFHTYGISHLELLSVSGLHPSDITCMASDAYHVYTACGPTIYAWRRGNELKHTYYANKRTVHLMLPFGGHLIAVDEDSNIKIWNIKEETSFLELTFSNELFHITTTLHPSTYINKILFGSSQGSLQLWNINTAKLIYNFKGWNAAITCLEQATALDIIAIGLCTGRIILHNLKYDETVMEFMQDWGSVSSISFRTDGHPIMATGSVTGHIVFWNLEEKRVASQLMSAHEDAVAGMVCLPNEPLIITSSADNTLKLWIFDMTDGGARLLRIREGHSVAPLHIRFHGVNGHNILSSAGDSTLRIFNTETERFNKSLGKASYNKKISKKRRHFTSERLKMPPIIQFTSETTKEKEWDNIAAIHSGLSAVTTWSYHKLKMGELKLIPERLQHKKSSGLTTCATCVCLTSCGNFVIIGYSDGYADRFNIQSGLWRDSYGDPKAHEGSVKGVRSDCLNQVTITAGSDCKVKFWKFKNNGCSSLTTLMVNEPVSFLCSHPESSIIAVALEDFSIVVVDIDTRTVIRKFEAHTAQLTDMTFSPDARWLISAAMDCSIRVWDIPSSQLIDQFLTNSACVSLSMSPVGDALATAHVDYLGIFLWSNYTLYSNVTLKPLLSSEEPPLIVLSEMLNEKQEIDYQDSDEFKEYEFVSPDQISLELITLSGLASSRWLNILNTDIIKNRNKPKQHVNTLKSAPFFLPSIPSLNLQFDLKDTEVENNSRLLMPKQLLNLSPFGKLLDNTTATNNFIFVIENLMSMPPSTIEFEIKLLAPDAGGSLHVMLQFFKCIEFMLKSKQHFELAQAYLGVFLKVHGRLVASEESLKNYLSVIQNCHSSGWNELQNKLYYSLCIVQNLKTM